jgi:hypothetical protein
MKANRNPAKPDWWFDGMTITVRVPMTFVRRGGRKMIVTPGGGDAWAPSRPRPDEALIRAIARAHRWKWLLEQKKYRSVSELAEVEGLTRSFVNRLLRLTLLAPDIVEAILDGRQPKEMQLEDLTQALPSAWDSSDDASSPNRRLILGSALRPHQLKAPSRTDCGRVLDAEKRPRRICETRLGEERNRAAHRVATQSGLLANGQLQARVARGASTCKLLFGNVYRR